MSVRTTATMTRPWSDIGRGFGALVGVGALAVGVPIALIGWVGWPLPAEIPTVDEFVNALRDTYIPDEFLIKTLALVCWVVWIELMTSLIVEAVAYFRGKQAGHVPLSGGVQRAAARLVATCALLGALAATKGMPEVVNRTLTPQSPVTLVVEEGVSDGASSDADHYVGQPQPPAPVYEVQRRDTLWDIAECYLGDPFRWPEIFELNRGVPQADGRVLTDPDLIFPGWQLILPGDATLAPAEAAPAPAPAPEQAEPPPPEQQPAPDPASGSLGDGMVLIDGELVVDGGLQAETAASVEDPESATSQGAASDYEPGGMVLLPDGTGSAAESAASDNGG